MIGEYSVIKTDEIDFKSFAWWKKNKWRENLLLS